MFATRSNNENAIYDQQTAAAAKPLNQGLKGLASKTPVHKSVHKIALNDENAVVRTKRGDKDGGLIGTEGKGDKVDKTAISTPAAIQNQEHGSVRGASPRLRRAKVKVQVDPLTAVGDEEREIEYMAPREVPLPDHPDDWPADRTYPQFEGRNLTKGWGAMTQPSKDEDAGDLSDVDAKLKKFEEREKKKEAQVKNRPATAKETKKPGRKVLNSDPEPSVLTSKGAAQALSSTGVKHSYAAPTLRTKSRVPSTLAPKRSAYAGARPAQVHHTAAKVASNTTLGYSKGRAVSANTRRPLSDIHRVPSVNDGTSKVSPMKMPFGNGSTLDELLGLTNLDDCDDDAVTLVGITSAGDALDEEFDDFQLPPV
nr:hypothetical protein CFP56_68178 [Quercus suber]